MAEAPQWCQRGRRRGAGRDRLGCLSSAATAADEPVAPEGLSVGARKCVWARDATERLAALRTLLPRDDAVYCTATGEELVGPNSKTRSARKSSGGQTKAYSRNEPYLPIRRRRRHRLQTKYLYAISAGRKIVKIAFYLHHGLDDSLFFYTMQ